MLAYEDPATTIDWLERAFGFREQKDQRYTDEKGTIGHAQLEAGDGLIMLAHRRRITRARSTTARNARRPRAGYARGGSSMESRSRSTTSKPITPGPKRPARDCSPASRSSRSGASTGPRISRVTAGCSSSPFDPWGGSPVPRRRSQDYSSRARSSGRRRASLATRAISASMARCASVQPKRRPERLR